MKRFLTLPSLFCSLLLFAATPTYGQMNTLWEIGKFDRSNLEFQPNAIKHVVYRVGQSNWTTDWPREQVAGSVYEIRFDLHNAPRGVFVLKVSALLSYPRIPVLHISINGHKGLYYLHPKPLYLADERYRLADVLTIELPDEYLTTQANSLTLSITDSRSEGNNPNMPAARIAYDFISLSNDNSFPYTKAPIRAEVVPTVFYKQNGDHLLELVDVFLRFGQRASGGSAVLIIEGKRYMASVPAQADFGEAALEFEIPEWHGTIPAHLQLIGPKRRNSFALSLTGARKWTVFVVPHTHVDIGYTDYQGKVAENQANALIEAADLIKRYPDFRFATDGSWNLQQLLNTRSQSRQDEILNLIREDKLGVPAQYFNLLTGYASLETLYRSLYYSKNLSIKDNLPFNYANITDVPSYTGAYPSLLASAGIKYWAAAGNNDRAPVFSHEQWDEKSPFWWQGPDGNKVLFWFSRGYSQIRSIFGADPENTSIRESLPLFLTPYDRSEYKPDAALMYGAQFENTALHSDLATFATDWNRSYAYPRLQYATFADFFTYIDKHYGSELETYKGDLGPYWEDGIESDAYFAAIDRRNQSDVLSAEVLSTASHLVNSDFHPPNNTLDDIWNNLLSFAEHTWGADRSIREPDSEESVKQLAIKDNFATQAQFEIADMTNRSLAQLVQQIHVPARTLVVFNALNWKRSALMEVDLNPNDELVDLTTNQVIPVEILANQEHFIHARFLASDLPPVGYKCFRIRTAAAAGGNSEKTTTPVIENHHYRISIDAQSGAIRSVFDKQLQREIVDSASPYRFGQYLYVTGGDPKGDGQTRMIHAFAALPLAELEIHPAGHGEYLGAEKTAWGSSIKLRSSAVNTPEIDLEVLLYDREKKIEFRYKVQKTYTTAKEAVYFSFPTAVTPPEFSYAIQQGWIDPSRDLLKGASLEWFNIQKWMAVHDPRLTVAIIPVDASLASFGDINRGEWPEQFHPKSSTIFSYVMNNYWHTNYRAGQGGTFTFSYVITSAEHLEPAALSRLGWESMEKPVLDSVLNQDKAGNPDRPLPAEGHSFLDVDAPNVVLMTWKLAEDQKGTILRLQEIGGRATEASVKILYAKVQSASLCNAVEDPIQALNVRDNQLHLAFRPHETLTIRLAF